MHDPSQWHASAFRGLADPVVVEAADGIILDVNPEAERVYGWAREELVGQSYQVLVPPNRHASAQVQRAECLKGVAIRGRPCTRRSRSGATYPVTADLTLVEDDILVVHTRHLPQLLGDQLDLAAREERYRSLVQAILDTAVDAILTIDESGSVESMNRAATRLFRYHPEEVLGQNIKMLMPSPDRERHDGYLERYRETSEPRIIGVGREVVGLRKDGTTFPCHLAVSEVHYQGRRVFAGFVRDVSEIRAAQNDLRAERDFAESLIDAAQVIVLLLDPNGHVLRFNRYLEEITGYRKEDVRGGNWMQDFIPERARARVAHVFERALQGQSTDGYVNDIVTRAGDERTIAWWNRALEDEAGNLVGVLAVGHDITELRRVQGELVQAERLAGIGEMITGLAHESRNALQRIQANLEMLELEIDANPSAKRYAARIQESQDYLSHLYEEVRGYAKPVQLARTSCDLRRLWRATWAELFGAEGMELVDATDAVPLITDADPFLVGQVFRNLFENAVAACGGRGRVQIEALPELEPDGRPGVRLRIADDGPGIAAEIQGRVFQPFFTTKTKGTGLGLAIVRRLIEAHGGTIVPDRSPLGGAAFLLQLPKVNDA